MTSFKETKLIAATIFLNYSFFQIISFLRAAGIFNTSYISVISLLLISLLIVFVFLIRLEHLKFSYIEILLVLIPLFYFGLGLFTNNNIRDSLADTYNAVVFVIIIVYFKHSKFIITERYYKIIANVMLIAMAISTIIFQMGNILGLNLYSVGATSIFFIFPTIVYMVFGMNVKFILSLVLLIIASKRGVLLAVMIAVSLYIIWNKKTRTITKTVLLCFIILFASLLVMNTLNPNQISKYPNTIQPLLMKTMLINPFSEYNNIEQDPRVLEISNALEPLSENTLTYIFGYGSGYTYEYINAQGELIIEDKHNVHFTPVSLWTKYGLIYVILIYFYIFKILFNSNKSKTDFSQTSNIVLLLYSFAAVFNSFTAFTIYLDYIFLMCLGILSRSKYHKGSEQIN